MTKKKAIIIITALICVILATGSGIGVILYKTNTKKTSGTVMTETNAVEIDENGNLVDGATGEKLSDEEIEKLKDKGVIKESEDGKVTIDQDKNKKKAEVKADKEDKTKDDSKKDSTDKNDKNDKSSDDSSKNESNTADAKKDDSSSNSSSENKKSDSGSQNNQNPQKPDPKPSDDNGNQPSTEQKNPEPSTEAPAKVCEHNWVWKTHTETKHHDAVTHTEESWAPAWDEPVYATKYQCAACGAIFDTTDGVQNHCSASDSDSCFNWGSTQVQVDTIHHEAELLDSIEIVDKEAWDEQIEVKDYQYCSKCGARK